MITVNSFVIQLKIHRHNSLPVATFASGDTLPDMIGEFFVRIS